VAEPPREDPLAALREHVRHAHAAAERLAFDAAGAPPMGQGPAGARGERGRTPPPAGGPTPPSGWAAPDPGPELGGELHALVDLVESLNGLLPPELRAQLHEVIRHILLLVRAVIDWLVDRMQRESAEQPTEVQDIPIR
jgi:hypothetical protein